MKKTVLTFGGLAGLVIIIYTYAFLVFLGDFSQMTPKDLAMAEWLGYLRYLILLLGVVMAMVSYRGNSTGPISYGRIFKVGLMAALVTAVFVGLMEYIYVAFINPDFFAEYAKVMFESMRQDGASASEIEEARATYETLLSFMKYPILTGLFYFTETTAIGTIFALITAIFTRRDEDSSPFSDEEALLNHPA